MTHSARRPYEPPTGDEPLDAIEQAIVRILVPIIAAQIREELAAEQRKKRDERADDPRAS